MAYPYIPGSDTAVFKAVGVFPGVVVSLSSGGLLVQAMSGLLLIYSRAPKPGECVHVEDVEGVVDSVGMFSTKVRTIINAALGRAEERLPVLSKLHLNIQDVFNEYGVQLMSPHYMEQPPRPAVVPKEQWYAAPAVNRVDREMSQGGESGGEKRGGERTGDEGRA